MKFDCQLSNRCWGEKNFFRLLPKVMIGSLAHAGFENFWLSRLIRSRFQLETRRHWILSLGLSWLGGLGPLLVIGLAAHFLSYLNVWTWAWGGARLEEPPAWMFLLGDARLAGLLFCSLLGFLPALLTGFGVWSWIFVPAALFPGIMSLPGGWICILAERLALWLRAFFVHSDVTFRRDIAVRFVVALSIWGLVLIGGAALRDWLQFVVRSDGFDPEWRLWQEALGLAIIVAIETAGAMLILNFYFPLTAEAVSPELWDLRLRRLHSPWDQEVLRQVRAKADIQWENLQSTMRGLDPSTRERIPPSVLSRMDQQIQELESLRQKS